MSGDPAKWVFHLTLTKIHEIL